MKKISYGSSVDNEDNTGEYLEAILSTDGISSNAVNRSIINQHEDVEENYKLLQTLYKNIYNTKNGILPSIMEEFNSSKVELGTLFSGSMQNTTSDVFLRIPTGAFVCKQFSDLTGLNGYGTNFDTVDKYIEYTYGDKLVNSNITITDINSLSTSAIGLSAGTYFIYNGTTKRFYPTDLTSFYTDDISTLRLNFFNDCKQGFTITNGDYIVIKTKSTLASGIYYDIINSKTASNILSADKSDSTDEDVSFRDDDYLSKTILNSPNCSLFQRQLAGLIGLEIQQLDNNVNVYSKTITEKNIEDEDAEIVEPIGEQKFVTTYPSIGYYAKITTETSNGTETEYFPSESENTTWYISYNSLEEVDLTIGDSDYNITVSADTTSSTGTFKAFAQRVCSAINSQELEDFPFRATVVQETDVNDANYCVKIVAQKSNHKETDNYALIIKVGSTTEIISKNNMEETGIYAKMVLHTPQQYYKNVFDLANSFYGKYSASFIKTGSNSDVSLEPLINVNFNSVNSTSTNDYYIYYNPDGKDSYVISDISTESSTGALYEIVPKELDNSKRFGKVLVADWEELIAYSELKPIKLFKVSITKDLTAGSIAKSSNISNVSSFEYSFDGSISLTFTDTSNNEFILTKESDSDSVVTLNGSQITVTDLSIVYNNTMVISFVYNNQTYQVSEGSVYSISSVVPYIDKLEYDKILTRKLQLDELISNKLTELNNSTSIRDRSVNYNRIFNLGTSKNYTDPNKELTELLSPVILLKDTVNESDENYQNIKIDYYEGIKLLVNRSNKTDGLETNHINLETTGNSQTINLTNTADTANNSINLNGLINLNSIKLVELYGTSSETTLSSVKKLTVSSEEGQIVVLGKGGDSYISTRGNLYLNTTGAATNTTGVGTVYLNSTVQVSASGGVTCYTIKATSARSKKKNIVPTTHINAIDEINKINIVDFFYKNDADNKDPKVGFIADDTDEVFSTKTKDTMDINNCIGMLLKAVQELSAKNKELENKVKKGE